MKSSVLHILFVVAVLVAAYGSLEAEEYVKLSENMTCEKNGEKYPVDVTCSSRDHPYRCDSNKKPCQCDPECVPFEDCCLDFKEESPNNSATWFDEGFITYTTCSPVLGKSHKTSPPKSFFEPYYLITRCPAHVASKSKVRQYCEHEPPSPDMPEDILITPIAIKGIGHFKNIYCAMCHDMNSKDRDVEPWKWDWECSDDILPSSADEYELTSDYLKDQRSCWASFKPPDGFVRSCLEVSVATCSLNFSVNNSDRVKCPSYLAPVQYKDLIYKNLECLFCNGLDICKQEDVLCKTLPVKSIVQSVPMPGIHSYFRFSLEATIHGLSCNPDQEYDPRTETCQDIECPLSEYNVTIKACEELVVCSKVCLTFKARAHPQMNSVTSPEDGPYLLAIAQSLILESSYQALASFIVSSTNYKPSCHKLEMYNIDDCNDEAMTTECSICFETENASSTHVGINLTSDNSTAPLFNLTSCQFSPSLGNISVTNLVISVNTDCAQPLDASCNNTDSFCEATGLRIASLIGYILSMLALLFVIITYSIFPQLRKVAGKSVLALCVALLAAYLLMSMGEVSTKSRTLCKMVAAATHFFLLSFFFWMNALAVDMSRTFGSCAKFQVRNESSTLFIKYSLYAWGMPTIIVGAGLIIDLGGITDLNYRYGRENFCWLDGENAILFGLGVPMVVLLLINVIMFIDTVVGIKRTKMVSENAREERSAFTKAKEEIVLYIKLSSVMGLTWILAFVSDVVNNWYAFAVVNSLHGVFILITFGRSRRITNLWREKFGMKPIKPKSSVRTYTRATKLISRSSSRNSSVKAKGALNKNEEL